MYTKENITYLPEDHSIIFVCDGRHFFSIDEEHLNVEGHSGRQMNGAEK